VRRLTGQHPGHDGDRPRDGATPDGGAGVHVGEHGHDGGHGHEHGTGVRALVRSVLLPHDHGAQSSDRVLESTAEGIRAVFVSLAGLAATAAIELVVALASHSVALLADTIHNFADALTAVPLALAFRMGRRPPTRRYTYGFGRAEDLAGVAIVGLIAASTAVAGYEAVSRLLHPHAVNGAGWVVAAGAVGFAGNELVAVYRIRVGRRIGSAALVADGLHARTDGFTSLAVVVGAAATAAGAGRADPITGLVITVAVALVLVSAVRTIYRRLMDSVDPSLVDQVESVLRGVAGVDAVDAVRVRWVGHELRAEIQISSDPGLSLVDAHTIADEAHHRLLHQVPRLAEAVIHTSPSDGGTRSFHEVVAHHFPDRTPQHPGRLRPVDDGRDYTRRSVHAPDGNDAAPVVVEEVTVVTPDVVAALGALVPELSTSAPALTEDAVRVIVDSPATVLLVARDGPGGTILGSLTLVVFSAPTGPRAWIEDVVVSTDTRGRGIGAALVLEALERGRAAGSRTVDLTSRPSREAANRLYLRLGFEQRQTNVYRRNLETESTRTNTPESGAVHPSSST